MCSLPDAAVAGEFASHEEVDGGPLLGAHLEDALVLPDRGDELFALGDGIGQRFFEVDVLARFGRGDGVGRMPEVGRDDEDAVEVLAGQELAEIAVGGDALRGVPAGLEGVDLLGQPLGVLEAVGIGVADGPDPGAGFEAAVDELLHVGLALAADADAAELEGVARGRPGEDGRRDDRRSDGGRRRSCLEEVSAVHARLPDRMYNARLSPVNAPKWGRF